MASWANGAFLSEGLADSRRQRTLQALGRERGQATRSPFTLPDWTAPGGTGLMAHDRRTSCLGEPAGGGSKRIRRLPASLTQASDGKPASLRVLIADDHQLFAEALSALLRIEDWVEVVGLARNGQEAVDMADALRPDLILIDLEMP